MVEVRRKRRKSFETQTILSVFDTCRQTINEQTEEGWQKKGKKRRRVITGTYGKKLITMHKMFRNYNTASGAGF